MNKFILSAALFASMMGSTVYAKETKEIKQITAHISKNLSLVLASPSYAKAILEARAQDPYKDYSAGLSISGVEEIQTTTKGEDGEELSVSAIKIDLASSQNGDGFDSIDLGTISAKATRDFDGGAIESVDVSDVKFELSKVAQERLAEQSR